MVENDEIIEIFPGFWRPSDGYGYTPLPNELFHILDQISSAELKVILYVLRHTWGYQDKDGNRDEIKKITTNEFIEGRKYKSGDNMDAGTGLSEFGVRDGLSKAIKHGFLICEIDDSDKGRIKKYYGPRVRETN